MDVEEGIVATMKYVMFFLLNPMRTWQGRYRPSAPTNVNVSCTFKDIPADSSWPKPTDWTILSSSGFT